jgi:hypothetical protein
MRLYDPEEEDALHFMKRAKAWERAGFVTREQRAAIDAVVDPGFRRAGVVMRGLLFIFTALGLAATFGCFLWVFDLDGRREWGTAALFFAVSAYAGAEKGVRAFRLHRHGVEEAFALAALACSSMGFYGLFLKPWGFSEGRTIALCSWVSLGGYWLYRRFGFLYGGLAALGALSFIPGQLDLSEASLRSALAVLFGGLFLLALSRRKNEEGDARLEANSFFQVVLLLGVYLSLNVCLPSLGSVIPWFGRGAVLHGWAGPRWFHVVSYVACWLLPAFLIAAGVRLRRRLFLDMGMFLAALTLATNKSYLGWTRYPWDPAVFGVLLAGVGWALSRRLKGRRSGFTADDLWKPESHGLEWAALGAAALAPSVKSGSTGPDWGGGRSGGGGTSSSF